MIWVILNDDVQLAFDDFIEDEYLRGKYSLY